MIGKKIAHKTKEEIKPAIKPIVKKVEAPVKVTPKPVAVVAKKVVCENCKGTGRNPLEIEDVCPVCKGVK